MKRPKLIVILLAGGVLLLGVGSVVAASLPSWPSHKAASAVAAPAHRSVSSSPVLPPSPAPSPTMPAQTPGPMSMATTAPGTPRATKPPAKSSITYTVKAGDTLSAIAQWFKLHGYGALYTANWAVIGSNPNLIFPGERITITNGVMKLSGTRS
jgi:nucleoid-associated protein YgaU